MWRTYQGGRRLEQWRGRAPNGDGNLPEDWVASVVQAKNPGREALAEGLSRILNAPDMPTLKQAVEESPASFLGSAHAEAFGAQTGVLVKLIDAAERLTIQVHPDKAFAKEYLHSDYGKTEAWYILGGQSGAGDPACVYLGFRPGVTKERWRRLFEAQDTAAMLDCLHRVPVRAGDVFFIDAGVPHAIGAGCFLAEIQEPTDYTIAAWRLWYNSAWGREFAKRTDRPAHKAGIITALRLLYHSRMAAVV